MTRILITGASGFVGRHTLEALLAGGPDGAELHATSRAVPAWAPEGAMWHSVDLTDADAARALIEAVRPTHLIHAAWYVTPGRFWTSPENMDWVGATLRLARLFHEAGGRRLVAVGTCAEYADKDGDHLEHEAGPMPGTFYGAAKLATWTALTGYARQVGLSFAWARLFGMYGPYEDGRRLVAQVMDSLDRGLPVDLTDGGQMRDFLAGQDVGAALARLCGSDLVGAVNIASGRPVTLRAMLEELGDLMDARGLLRFGARPRPASEPPRLTGDIGRATRELGWQPALDLREGLALSLAWRRRHAAVSVSEA